MNNQAILIVPRFDIGLAPIIDGWALRRRIATAKRAHRRDEDAVATAANPRVAETVEPATSRNSWRSTIDPRAQRLGAFAVKGWQLASTLSLPKIGLFDSRPLALATKVATAAAITVAAAPPFMAALRYTEVRETYGLAIANRAAISVYAGRSTIGMVSRTGDADAALSRPSKVGSDDELYQMYNAVEGAGHRFSYFGIPVRSVVRATACHAGLPVVGDCRGASGGIQHAVRGLSGGYGGDGSAMRSLREFLLDGPALSVLYPEGDARAGLILDNLNFGYLPGGRPIIGVVNASQTVFGESNPRALSLAQKSILISLLKYPLAWDSGAGANVENRARLRRRAAAMLVTTYGTDDARVAAALRELARPDLLPARPVAPVLPLSGPVGRAVAAELKALPQQPVGSGIEAIELTLASAPTQAAYERDFLSTLAGMPQRQHFDRSLLAGDERADSLAVNTVANGAIQALAATSPRIGLSTRHSAGSHTKWIALLALARSARFDADSMLCNRSQTNVQNAGGDTGVPNCVNGRGLKTMADVFRKSMNLPLLDALDRVPASEVREAMLATGVEVPDDGANPAHALVLGTAVTDAATIIALSNALSSFANGGPAVGEYPYIIRRVKTHGLWSAPNERRLLDLRPYLRGETTRRLIRAICPAPLEGGTMQDLSRTGKGSEVSCAKSSTVAGSRESGYRTISKALTAASPSGGWYVYIGAPKGYLGPSELTILPAGNFAQDRIVRR